LIRLPYSLNTILAARAALTGLVLIATQANFSCAMDLQTGFGANPGSDEMTVITQNCRRFSWFALLCKSLGTGIKALLEVG